MASKNIKLPLLKFYRILFFPYLLSLIISINSLSFKYPTAFTLKDERIFVIHSLGIDICDSKYTTSTNIIMFPSEMNESNLSKISISKYSTGEFIIFIFTKIYLFDEYGTQKIVTNDLSYLYGEYYTLTAHKKVQNSGVEHYYFLFGYIDISNDYNYILDLYYYRIFSSSNSIIEIAYKSFDYDIEFNGLSCDFIKYNDKDYIMCSFELDADNYLKPFCITFFYIDGSSIKYENRICVNLQTIEFIHSTQKSINSKPFFCSLDIDGNSFCSIYDLNEFYNEYENGITYFYYDDENEKNCIVKPYNIKTYYFPETDEYVFSCLTEDHGIQTTIYKKNMEEITDIENPSLRLQKEFKGCGEFYYSIIYSNYYQKYFIISDIDCDNYKQFMPLIAEEVEEDEKKEEEKEEENIEEKEEKKIEETIKEEETVKEEEKKVGIMTEEEKENKIEKDLLKEEEKKEKKKEIKDVEENKEEKEEEGIKMEEIEVNKIEKFTEKESKEEKGNENEKTEIIYEEEKEFISFYCNLEKCIECTKESLQLNLCKKCNIEKGYYPLNTGILPPSENNYIDCFNKTTKPENFYLDIERSEYKLCYSNCKTCNYGGDGNNNNCTSCRNNQILKPDILNSSNCVIQCEYFYYYQNTQYKCTSNQQCPENYPLEIKEKNKCIDKCEKDDIYKIQYDGQCYNYTPEGTIYDELNKISKDIIIDKCKSNDKILRLITNDNITEYEINQKAKLYAKEFDYTDKHVTIYKNDFYSITLYKDLQCLSELDLNIDEIDFGECYNKIKDNIQIHGNLIIVIIAKIFNGISFTIDKFIFNPKSGEKINYIEICKNATVTVKRKLKEQLKNATNINSLEELTEQGIDIFDPNSNFYTDLCFHFKSPIDGKDIPVKDRLKLFFPNITLCDEGCSIKGVNLTSWKIMCQCILNNLVNTNIFGNSIFLKKSIGEMKDILSKTNIEVMKCYKDLFNKDMYKNNLGFIIILFLIVLKLFWIFVYYFKYKNRIKKYAMGLTDKFILFLKINKNNNLIDSSIKPKNLIIKSSPPRHSLNIHINSENQNKEAQFFRITNKKKSKTTLKKKKIRNKNNFKNLDILYKHGLDDLGNKSEEILREKHKEFEQILPNSTKEIKINMEEYIETEPDNMDYEDAIRRDKRTFCQYFCDKIKTEQIILSTFFQKEILKPLPIKIILLILNIDLYLIINALFFNENYISDLLHSEKDTVKSFIYRILDRIVYITIAGVIINYIIEFFFVDENKIKGVFKREKENILILKYEIVQIIKNTYIKYNIFIILSSLIMIVSIYYIFCFNNIYSSIKGEWIKSSVVIIIVMQVLPIFLGFLDTCIRFISFKCKSERLFRLSSILL